MNIYVYICIYKLFRHSGNVSLALQSNQSVVAVRDALHWLPAAQLFELNVARNAFKALNERASAYLTKLAIPSALASRRPGHRSSSERRLYRRSSAYQMLCRVSRTRIRRGLFISTKQASSYRSRIIVSHLVPTAFEEESF